MHLYAEGDFNFCEIYNLLLDNALSTGFTIKPTKRKVLNIERTTFMEMPPESNHISSMYYFFSLTSYLASTKFNTLPFGSSFSN